jgi:hypothetical protein
VTSIKRNWVVLLTLAVVGCLWTIPLTRGIMFLSDTKQAYGEIGSLNSYADYEYARQLMIFYVAGTIVTELLALMFVKTTNPVILIHLGLALGVLSLAIIEKPHVRFITLGISPIFLAAGYALLFLAAVPCWIMSKLDRMAIEA